MVDHFRIMFVQMCVLCGCDYLPHLDGVGEFKLSVAKVRPTPHFRFQNLDCTSLTPFRPAFAGLATVQKMLLRLRKEPDSDRIRSAVRYFIKGGLIGSRKCPVRSQRSVCCSRDT